PQLLTGACCQTDHRPGSTRWCSRIIFQANATYVESQAACSPIATGGTQTSARAPPRNRQSIHPPTGRSKPRRAPSKRRDTALQLISRASVQPVRAHRFGTWLNAQAALRFVTAPQVWYSRVRTSLDTGIALAEDDAIGSCPRGSMLPIFCRGG